jgi:nicotinate-nucleotide adenylyltransferase
VSEHSLGLLGGTFNPIHFGHLQLAMAAMSECCLERVIFLPSALPPHKISSPLATFVDRLAMVRLAIEGESRFSCSDIEHTLPAPSYTIETLRAVEQTVEIAARLSFLIGSDAFMDLLSWREYDQILRRVALIVVRRRDDSAARVDRFLQQLGYNQVGAAWIRPGGYREIMVLQGVPDKYSSTAIREKIAAGVEPHGEVPPAVLAYIRERGLYSATPVPKNISD